MPVYGNQFELTAESDGVGINAKIVAGNFRVIATKNSIMNEFGLFTVDNSEGFTPGLFETNQIVYVQDDDKLYQLKTINNFQIPSGPPPFLGINPDLPNSSPIKVWEEFTGFGSSSPGEVSDPFITNGLTVNSGGSGTTLDLQDEGTLTLTAQDSTRILQINSASLSPVIINEKGLIVLDNYPSKPTVESGAIVYEDGDFYIGTPDPINFFNIEEFYSSQLNQGLYQGSTTPLSFTDNGLTDSARELNLITPAESVVIELQTSTITTNAYGDIQFMLLTFDFELNSVSNYVNDATIYISTVDNFSTPEAATIYHPPFNVKEGSNKLMIDVNLFNTIHIFWIFTIPNRSYTISNLFLTKLL
tara:strand:+ start:663 stop:1742 length:1080 start_codon:yes stop_codon:yes gene_type:complete